MVELYETSEKVLPLSILFCIIIQIIGLFEITSDHDAEFRRRIINYITVYLIILILTIGVYVGCRKRKLVLVFFILMMFLFFMTQYYTDRGEDFVDFFDESAKRLEDLTNQRWDKNIIVEQYVNFLAIIALILSTFVIVLISPILFSAYSLFNLSDKSYASFIEGNAGQETMLLSWILGVILFLLIYFKAKKYSFRIAIIFSICFVANMCAYSYSIDEGHIWDQRYEQETFESLSDFEDFSGITEDYFPYLLSSAFVFALIQVIGGYMQREVEEESQQVKSIFE